MKVPDRGPKRRDLRVKVERLRMLGDTGKDLGLEYDPSIDGLEEDCNSLFNSSGDMKGV